MKWEYWRIQEQKIKDLLAIFGCVLIEGPKQSGKTFIATKIARSAFYVQENGLKNLEFLNWPIPTNPIFKGNQPRLIDEWQIIPQIWDKVRFIIDQSIEQRGLFILTGSSAPNYKKIFHNGAGRIAIYPMHTLTFAELTDQKEKISLKKLFANEVFMPLVSNYEIDWVVRQLLKGGWPFFNNDNFSPNFIKNYLETITRIDEIGATKINQKTFFQIIKSLARLNGSQLNKMTILKDLDQTLSIQTVTKYLNYLSEHYLSFELELWSGIQNNKRSRIFSKTKPKVYLCDPSLGLHLLNIKNIEALFGDLNTLGIYFENQVIKDLIVYAQALDGKIYFYKDSNDFEIDAIMELDDGSWAAFEIKLGDAKLDEAAKKLVRFQTKIAKLTTLKPPKFLMIINAAPFSYQRPDGVYVVSHTSLSI